MTSMRKEEKEKRKNNKVLTIFRNLQPFIVLSYNMKFTQVKYWIFE